MKKIISLIMAAAFISNGLVIVGQSNNNEGPLFRFYSICNPTPIFCDDGKYIKVEMNNSEILYETGKPMLPVITKILSFPLGTKIINVNIQYDNENYFLSKKIALCNQTKIHFKGENYKLNDIEIDYEIYNFDEVYPEKSFYLKTSAGLYENEHVLFLSLKFIPQYNPKRNLISIPKQINIGIKYMPVEEPLFSNDEYDMIIIAPEIFSNDLQPLISHKNSVNIRTILKTREQIYNEFSGRDEAEKIKYCIKDSIEKLGIRYVLLVGDINKIPMRRSKVDCAFIGREGILTDLYYADIYDANGSFCSWDSNENMNFGEYSWNIYTNIEEYIDVIDLYPDVGVGRLPCINNREVQIIVDKIINYETQTYGTDWFKRILLMGGNCDKSGYDVYEGEWKTEIIGNGMENYGFISIKLWTSLDTFNPRAINREINQGAGFISYAGHGDESGIATYTPEEERISYENYHLLGLINNNKLPVVYLDACSSGNLDFSYSLIDILPSKISYFISNIDFLNNIFKNITFSCIGWEIVKKQLGGGILSICSTDVAYDSSSRGPFEDLSHYIKGTALLHVTFFRNYDHGIIISDMFTSSIINYLNEVISIGEFPSDPITVEEYSLIGDPSLKIGGYP
jgi:peptidase C25-like protein